MPIPESTYKIKELEVDVKLAEQVAKVQVAQSFVNTGSRPMEVCFVFPLPYDGAVDQLTLLIDGKEFPAKLLPADEARHMYEEIVRKNRDPALLEWMGTGLFKTSVFPVPPGAERKVTLRYSQLCRKTDGLTDFLFPLSTAKYTSHPVESIKFNVAIDSATEIKNVYSPTHAVEINRPDDKHAVVSYKAENKVPSSDFRLFYDVGQGHVGATVLSYRHDTGEDGYFLLLASPEIKAAGDERPKKTVVFVVDRSGSMSGEKIEQAKGAAKFVLNNLREGDLFNIIAFDSEVESWKPELQKYNDETRKAALGFIEGIYAGGSTNIDGALEAAFAPLHDSGRPTIVLFLTDGLPTVGEQNEAKIIENAKKYNHVNARVFTFGVGYDLNSRLLDKLAREGFGQSEFVRPNENIEDRVSAALQTDQRPGAERSLDQMGCRRSQLNGWKARQSRLSKGRSRTLGRRAIGDRRPLQEAGRCEGDRQRQGRRQGGEVRFPRQARRKESRRGDGVHRKAVGRAANRRDSRRAGFEGQERRVG